MLHRDHVQLGELLFALDEAMDSLEHHDQLPPEQRMLWAMFRDSILTIQNSIGVIEFVGASDITRFREMLATKRWLPNAAAI